MAGTKRAGSSLGSAGKKPRVEVPRPQWVVESCAATARQDGGRSGFDRGRGMVEAVAWAEAADDPGAEAAAATGDAEPEGATALTTERLHLRDICVYCIYRHFFNVNKKNHKNRRPTGFQ